MYLCPQKHRRLYLLRRGPNGRDTEELRHVAGHQGYGITNNRMKRMSQKGLIPDQRSPPRSLSLL